MKQKPSPSLESCLALVSPSTGHVLDGRRGASAPALAAYAHLEREEIIKTNQAIISQGRGCVLGACSAQGCRMLSLVTVVSGPREGVGPALICTGT